MPSITRRGFVAALPLAGELACPGRGTGDNRLAARPGLGAAPASAGGRPLKLRQVRDGLLYAPASSSKREKAPLAVSLHGASKRVLLELQREGDQVTYREFDGPPTPPPEIAPEAKPWLLNPV